MVRSSRPARVVSAISITVALILSACSAGPGGSTAPSGTGSLTVLDWAGYDAPDFWTDFQKAYPKVTVGFEIGASDADIYGKMSSGDQADIFHPYTGWLQFYVDQGLVEPIDTSKLKNWSMVPDSFKKIGQIGGEPELVQGMQTGDVWAAYAWQGAYATLLTKGVPVAYATPKEGRNSWVGVYGIRKGTPNLDLAYKFLDAKLGVATGNNVVTQF